MKQNYNYALQQVLISEGGYSNDPRDPGGPTNFGITLNDYRSYINPKGTALDVKNMTQAQAAAIYKPKYWDKVNGDSLPSGVDYCVFDYGVNSGVSRAVKVYKSLAPKYTNPVDLINAICDQRLAFLKGLGTWSTFGKGWSTRVASVRANSIKLPQGAINATHSTAATVAVAGAASAYHWSDYWPYILGGTAVAVGLAYLIYYLYRKYNGNPSST